MRHYPFGLTDHQWLAVKLFLLAAFALWAIRWLVRKEKELNARQSGKTYWVAQGHCHACGMTLVGPDYDVCDMCGSRQTLH